MTAETLATVLAVFMAIPLLAIGTECLVVLLFDTQSKACPEKLVESISYKILMPAHNEAGIIGKTLAQLIAILPDAKPQNIVLVADNCSDDTAKIARDLGATVLERHDANLRGKGFALDHGIQQLANNQPPDVLVIMDADCESDQASLINLINTVAANKLPAQMVYLMRVVENATIKQKISGFAWLLKNKVRLLAMNKLGFPVTLTGTGMAFPWSALTKVNVGHGNIVEDMQLGIDCAILGFPPVFCSKAYVYSDFPEQATAELSQRTRWEHGHLQTILHQVPRLIAEGFHRKDCRLFALALDIGVPPLSLLVMLAVTALVILAVFSIITKATTAFLVLLFSFCYFALTLVGIWRLHGQAYLSADELAGVPRYIFSKLSIYINFLFKRQKEWIRTKRDT